MHNLRSPVPIWVALLLALPILLTATSPTTAEGDAIPGTTFDHQNGWYAMRLNAPEGGFFAEVRVDDLWHDSQIRGATLVSVLDATGQEVGSFTFVGEDGGLTLSAEVGGVTVAPEPPQPFTNDFRQQILFLLYFPVQGEHTLVFAGASEGGFTGAIQMFVQPEDILAESSGTEAHFVSEADLDCLAGVNAVTPTQEADGALIGVVALAGCTYPFEATSGFAGLVRMDDQIRPEATEFGIRTPAGDRIEPTSRDEMMVVADTPGAWAIEVDTHLGRASDGTWGGVTAIVADVAMP